MTPSMMAVALGTTVGIFAASVGGPAEAEAIIAKVDQVARAVVVQAGEAS